LKIFKQFLFICCLQLLTNPADAHQVSTAYLNLQGTSSDSIQVQYQIRLVDLVPDIELDLDGNHEITWAEVKASRVAINDWLTERVVISQPASQCVSDGEPKLQMDEHFSAPYLVVEWSIICGLGQPLNLHYQGVFEHHPEHKLIVSYHLNDLSNSRILTQDKPQLDIQPDGSNHWDTFKEFTVQGVIHILIGWDHILFLLTLLLSAVLVNPSGKKHSVRQPWWQVVGLVTAFTLSHSVTLVLTAMDVLSVSSRWVELIIAFTVAIAALNNIKPFIGKMVAVTFVFGLVHGMGFAGVLGELGLPAEMKWLPVLAFNLGVELGQLLLVLLMFPVLLWINSHSRHAHKVFKTLSVVILLMALVWMVQRY